MAEYELVIEEAQREDSVSLAQLLETVTLESDFLAQDDRSSVLNGEQLASYIDSRQSVPNEICLVAKLGHEVIGVCNVTSIKTRRPVTSVIFSLRLLNLIGAMVLVSFLWEQ